VNEPISEVASHGGRPGATYRKTQITTGVSNSQTARNDSTTPSTDHQAPRTHRPLVVGSASSSDSSRAGAAASSGSHRIRPRHPTSFSPGRAIDANARRRPSPYRVAGSRLASARIGVRFSPASMSALSAPGAPMSSGSAARVRPVRSRTRSAPVASPVIQIASNATGTTAIPL
jgi:hypothetical protein